jgi:rsbT co-antagonist protein RsbR
MTHVRRVAIVVMGALPYTALAVAFRRKQRLPIHHLAVSRLPGVVVTPASATRLPELLTKHEGPILDRWVEEQLATIGHKRGLMSDAELREQSREFLALVRQAAQSGGLEVDSASWTSVRDFLGRISTSRAVQGFSPAETAIFVFSLKQPVIEQLRRDGGSAEGLFDEVWRTNLLLDRLGLYTTEVYQKGREQVILRQQEEMLELSTPVVKLWDGVLALPMIGTLDSARTQIVMEALLQRIVETGANVAIIDITGVPTVDTLVAQHLIKTITAARLMGADCIISGIRPQIASTIVHLGVDLSDVVTKATLADAFGLALDRLGLTVGRAVQRR